MSTKTIAPKHCPVTTRAVFVFAHPTIDRASAQQPRIAKATIVLTSSACPSRAASAALCGVKFGPARKQGVQVGGFQPCCQLHLPFRRELTGLNQLSPDPDIGNCFNFCLCHDIHLRLTIRASQFVLLLFVCLPTLWLLAPFLEVVFAPRPFLLTILCSLALTGKFAAIIGKKVLEPLSEVSAERLALVG